MQQKLLSRLFFSAKVLLTISIAEAQYDPLDTSSVSLVPFRKGNWEVQTRKYLWGNRFNEKEGDQDLGSSSRFNLSLETHYWASDHFAYGLELNYDATKTKNGIEIKTSDFLAYGHFTYGRNFGTNWGMYLRGGAGVGFSKGEFSPQEAKSDVFSYKFELGAPIHLHQQLFFTPYLNYKYISTDFDNNEQNEKRFRVGVNFVSYLNCGRDEYYDDTSGIPWPRRYAPRVFYIGVHSMTGYSFGNTESIFNSITVKEDLNRFNLKFDLDYYVIPNLAIGANLGFRSSVTKNPDSDYENSRTRFSFGPKVSYNFPTNNWLNDMFVTVGGGFGSQKNETTTSGNTNTHKDNITFFGGGLGYNWFVSRSSLFTFSLGYEQQTSKNDDNDLKIKESGLTYEVGFRTGFNIKPRLNF